MTGAAAERWPRPQELAPGVYRVETGRWLTEANVYLRALRVGLGAD